MMAGRSDQHNQHQTQQQQQQQQNLQNVVVYVSNENFAQAYATAVNQNVNATPYQQSQNNQSGIIQNTPQSVAAVGNPNKNKSHKAKDFQTSNNGLANNVSFQQQTSFYASSNNIQNGFNPCHNANNISFGPNNVGNPNYNAPVKNVANFGNPYAVQNSLERQTVNTNDCNGFALNQQRLGIACYQTEHNKEVASIPNANIIQHNGNGNFVTVMGGDNNGGGATVFPRCDSVRSETAESSCSSLSSSDSQNEPGTISLLLPSNNSPGQQQMLANNNVMHQNSSVNNMMMLGTSGYNLQHPNGPSFVQRNNGQPMNQQQQQLSGNIVLAMRVPPQQQQQQQQQATTQLSRMSSIAVPNGWKRIVINGGIAYLSPSNTALTTVDQMREYLQTTGTCKCGLDCPLILDNVFSFDPKVATRPGALPTDNAADLTKLCNHKRKLLPAITDQPPTEFLHSPQTMDNTDGSRRKKQKTSDCLVGYQGSSAAPQGHLVAQREGAMLGILHNKEGAPRPTQAWSVGMNQMAGPNHQMNNRPPFPQTFPDASNPQQIVNNPQFVRYPIANNSQQPNIHQHAMQHAMQMNPNLGGPTEQATNDSMVQQQRNQEERNKLHQQVSQQQSIIYSSGNHIQQQQQQQTTTLSQHQQQQQHEMNMLRMHHFYAQQNQYQVQQRLEDAKMQQQHQLQTQQQPQQQQQQHMQQQHINVRPHYVPVSCNNVGGQPMEGYGGTQATSQTMVHMNPGPPMLVPGNTMVMNQQHRTPPWQQRSQNAPTVYERVPPLHHHVPPRLPPAWNEEVTRKKRVPKATLRKQRSYASDRANAAGLDNQACPNIDVRQIPPEDNRPPPQNNNSFAPLTSANVPSFMEDPTGYLAQQTALLNSTISRQTGVGSQNYMAHSPIPVRNTNSESQLSGSNPSSTCTSPANVGVPLPSNVLLPKNNYSRGGVATTQQTTAVYQTNPDSVAESHCQGCSAANHGKTYGKSPMSDDNPVTSSTLSDRANGRANVATTDSRGPIQGGTISTSNGSPVDGFNLGQLEASPPSSCHISSSSSAFAMSNSSPTGVYSYPSSGKSCVPMTCSPGARRPGEFTYDGPKAGQAHCTVTTMASGRTVSSNTITSVLAGRANTATVTVGNSFTPVTTSPSNFALTNQPISVYTPQPVVVPQNPVSKSPLEMVQSVVSSIQVPHSMMEGNQQRQHTLMKQTTNGLPPGHILVSSNGQLIMTNASNVINANQNLMAPPPQPGKQAMPPLNVSPMVTSVTAAMSQVIPTVTQQVLGQPTVLVNAPLLLQPGMVMDGMTMGQNVQIPHLAVATGNMIQGNAGTIGQLINTLNHEAGRGGQNFVRPHQMVSPEANPKKKAGKKRKVSQQTVASMLHIAAQQNANSMVVQQQQNFQQQSFTMSQPIMQALTIVPGKAGGPAQILMNGQSQGFNTQQLIATSASPQQQQQNFNLLQPMNLINSSTGVVQNFPTFQQFIVPGLGGMVMSSDGTATLLPDTSNISVQLQLQNVNGQNVLTPVQSQNVFGQGQSILAAGPAGMVIRTPNPGKMIQQNSNGQFLSSTNQFLMNGSPFGGQMSPLVANVSPNQQMTFTTTGNQIRAQNPNQEFIQCGQIMVPCSVSASNPSNTTVVQQNTTIVQQQTTMVSNNQQSQSTDTSEQYSTMEKVATPSPPPRHIAPMMKHSVSTQTAVNQAPATADLASQATTTAGSPPDTTTHSPVGASSSPQSPSTTVGPPPDDTPKADLFRDCGRLPMVHCISSSNEQETTIEPGDLDWSGGNKPTSNVDAFHTDLLLAVGPEEKKSIFVESTDDRRVYGKEKALGKPSEKSSKRKHSDALVVMETQPRDLNALDDDDDEESGMVSVAGATLADGDLVWGAARGFPAWPGKLAGPPPTAAPDAKVWVRWFGGDRALTQVPLQSLKTLTEGLDAHHRARKKFRKSRKLNSQLENAIQEAMLELDRMTESLAKAPVVTSVAEATSRTRRNHR